MVRMKYPYTSARTAFSALKGLSFASLLALSACSEPPPLKLTLTQRDLVDTMYLRRVNGLGPQLDSACQAQREPELKRLLDSVLLVRRSEEEKLRAKYQGKSN